MAQLLSKPRHYRLRNGGITCKEPVNVPTDLSRLLHALLHPGGPNRARVSTGPLRSISIACETGGLVKFDLAGVLPSDLHLAGRGGAADAARPAAATGASTKGPPAARTRWKSRTASFRELSSCPVRSTPTRITTDYRDGMLLVRLVAQEETR